MRNHYFFISDTGGSEEKIQVEPNEVWTSHGLDSCYENSDFLFRATCVIIKNSFSQNLLHQKRKYQPDPIRVSLTARENLVNYDDATIYHNDENPEIS